MEKNVVEELLGIQEWEENEQLLIETKSLKIATPKQRHTYYNDKVI